MAGDTFFSPDLKCCTYHPTLPNFLVGALFADADPALDEGRRRVRAAIARRAGVSPEWVGPPRKYRVLLEAGRVRGFGRARALVCPYLDSGRCSIWRHRESVHAYLTERAIEARALPRLADDARWSRLRALRHARGAA